ncbi:type IV pilin-like G/H family protein [Phormidium tenue FACHB-886]|nr:type IV pilin-like G/H family protein [Phormidium tenue FACHB-886]
MKFEFQAKFLQHLLRRKQAEPLSDEQGFTLIELLVVIIIIGILAAIALPSFLSQAAKAKQSEAKIYVGSVNRAQQAYRIEKPQFAATVEQLQIGIPTETTDYKYEIFLSTPAQTKFDAIPKDPTTLRAYTGGVMVVTTTGQFSTGACQTTRPSAATPAITFSPTEVKCADVDQVMR